jgi:hypothetical protein
MSAPHKHPEKPEKSEETRKELHDVTTFIEWEAPGRPFIERSREYFYNGFLILAVLEILVYLVFKSIIFMLTIFSLCFLWFALSIVPPHKFYYKITSEGIRIEDYFYLWDELYDFYFIKHHSQEVLCVTTKDFFPGELKVTLGDIPPEQIKSILLPYLPYREYVKPTFMEKSGNWLSENFPLEKKSP